MVDKTLIYIFFENGSFRENNKYFFIYNHVKVCSALHLEQKLFHAIKNMHFTTYAELFRYIMLEVITLKEFHEFCDTTYKCSMYM